MNIHHPSERPISAPPAGRVHLFVAGAVALAGLAAAPAARGADDPAAAEARYSEAVKGAPGLLGYWPLHNDLQAAHGGLKLVSNRPAPATTEGPFGGRCIDLSDGNDLVIQPTKELDAPELSFELVFRIVKAGGGNPCLFAIRNAQGTRFSLHYNAGERDLLVWNGGALTRYQANDPLVEKDWYHLALSFTAQDTRLWLNGKECKRTGDDHRVAATAGLPFVLGGSVPAAVTEHAAIAVAHLAIYGRPLDGDEVVRHLTAAGWLAKTRPQLAWQECPVSILESQIGYHPRNVKHAYLRSAVENPPQEFLPREFRVIDARDGKKVFRGKVASWGRMWDTWWWVLDFTPLRMEGEFLVEAGKLVSTPVTIRDGVFHQTDLAVVALDQLEHRIHQGIDDQRSGLRGKYVNCGPDVRIYMDCGSPYAELEPVGTCVYALLELHDLLGDKFSAADRKRMIDLAALGADYFVAAQRHTDDPETDGMFHHSLLVNTNDTWAGDIFTYLDTAYGMALLAKAHQFFAERDPARAARYLAAAEKAWRLCTHRPYHTAADRTMPPGVNAYFWNAPAGIQDTFGRCLYNFLDEKWKMPDSLRTRDRLPFIQGSALMFEITGEKKYLDKAVEFADAVIERQFTDWEHPIDGCFGNFHEFEGNDEVFFHEFMQGGFWWEGNVEALNLEGLMRLLRLAPAHPRAAAWLNAVMTYAENYALCSTTRNPLGIYPVACYKDPQHGGLKYFQNTLMGSSCLFGFSAKNFMVLGEFLRDSRFQAPALAGVNFVAGLNPGIPNAYEETAWDARTLIQGVGRSWFGPAGDVAATARGSVPNGFCAAPQFWLPTFTNFISNQSDRPRGMIGQGGGLQFNEGWILHSHAYVHGVARLEAGHRLALRTLDAGKPAAAAVAVALTEDAPPHANFSRTYQTGGDGALVIDDLPTPGAGTLRITCGGRTISRPVAAVAGARHAIEVDFAREPEVAIEVPATIGTGAAGTAAISITNAGSGALDLKLGLAGAGVTLERDELAVSLQPGGKKTIEVGFRSGERVMPYLVRALVVAGAPAQEFHAAGRIGSRGGDHQ